MQQVPGPRAPDSGSDPGNPTSETLFKYLERVYHDAALDALHAIDLDMASVDHIIDVILEKTSSVKTSALFDSANTEAARIAIVYAFWLTESTVDDLARIILLLKKDEVFRRSGVDSDEHAKLAFADVMKRDENIRAMEKAPGPLESKMKLLETISRISDLI